MHISRILVPVQARTQAMGPGARAPPAGCRTMIFLNNRPTAIFSLVQGPTVHFPSKQKSSYVLLSLINKGINARQSR